MGRNKKDFQYPIGQNWTGYHIAPRRARKTIEAGGLKANTSQSIDGGNAPHGVYVSNSREDHEWLVQGGGHPNKDIYEVTLPVAYADPDMPHDAAYSKHDIAPHNVTRVGHTTADGDVHWHRAEHCNG